jgi:hypothetical protein
MEYISMAQSVGDEPIRDSGWTPDDIQEWFGGDMDDARESFDYDREEEFFENDQEHEETLQEENDRLRKELALYRGYAGCAMTQPSCTDKSAHSSLTCYPRYLDFAGDEGEYVQTADEWTLSGYRDE